MDRSILPYIVKYDAKMGTTVLVIDTRIHFCDEVTKVCLADFIRVKIPVQVTDGTASSQIKILIPLQSQSLV